MAKNARKQTAQGAPNLGTHTSNSPSATPKRPMFNRATATPEDRYWYALGKQVRQGAGTKLTVRR